MPKIKKEKRNIIKLIDKSNPENDDNEHELSFYINDRVKLMKEVLKIIKPKKIKSMAPDCIKDLDIEEINSMLLEELLGISNKRLKYIFSGQSLGEDTSSTDSEEEKQPIDIISLDDVSDDDFVIVDSDKTKNKGSTSSQSLTKRIKKEKNEKYKTKKKDTEENLMSVLELLELQARARAIRSQLLLESSKKEESQVESKAHDSDPDDVIIEIPTNEEIVINSSDSESDQTPKKKITLNRSNFEKEEPSETDTKNREKDCDEPQKDCENDDDEIILVVDHEEMEGIIGD